MKIHPLKIFRYLWTAPNSLLGLCCLCIAGRKSHRIVDGVLEIWGGGVTRILTSGWLPSIGSARAMTLGHVIIGVDAETLESVRSHEMIHVRQYERWGPLFIPAYAGCSLWLGLRGYHPYLDNPFEVEAFENS